MYLRGRLQYHLEYQQFKVHNPHAQKIRVRRGITKYRYPIKRLDTCHFMNHVGLNNTELCNIINQPISCNIPLYIIISSNVEIQNHEYSIVDYHILKDTQIWYR